MNSPATQSWGGHFSATVKLGVPLVGSQLAGIGMGVTDTIMLGWLGAEPLAASVLGVSFLFTCMIAGSGPGHAVAALAAGALGAGDETMVRRVVRMGLWASILFCVFCGPLWWHGEAILLAMGQVPELAALAGAYLKIAGFGLILHLTQMVFRSYLSAFERANVVLYATLAGLLLNIALNYAFIFGNWGAPSLGIRGAAVATLGTHLLIVLLLVVFVIRAPFLRKYELFVRFWRPDWAALGDVFRLGWPISLTLLAEVSLFSLASIMIGWLGTIPLAAHGIALQVTSVVFMIPLGLSFAATARAGRAIGRRDRTGLIRASVAVGSIALGFAVLSAALLYFYPSPLIRLFLESDNPDIAAITATGVVLLAVAALFQLVDTAQVIALGLLRGIKDTRVPMIIAVTSYLGFGVAAAYGLAFTAGMGAVGVWFGLAAGLALAALLLWWRYFRMLRSI